MASITKHGFLFVLVGMLGLASFASAEAGGLPAVAPVAKAGASALPLRVPFIQNQGQVADPQVLFYARTFGGTVYVTAEGQIVYALPRLEDTGRQTADDGRRMAVIHETLVDADLAALPSGAERSGAIINSFVGNDPRRWQANIPSFAGVQFGDIYEGISLEVRATGDNVEKIFTVAPGADPARIALRLAGAEGVSITPSGELEARTALGPVRFTAPVAYQRSVAGERQDVSVAYALEGDQVGFCVGAFDAARPLVIDPLLASTFIGGTNGANVISAMVLDSQTNVLVAGYTASDCFPTTNTPFDAIYNGEPYDGFIAKFDPQLTNLLAATYLGGAGEDKIMAMVISTNGAVYVAGYTASGDFPITNAAYSNYNGGAYDAFVSVLDGNLTNLTASTYLGGTNVDMAFALALGAGPTQDVFVTGLTASTNFPVTNTFGNPSFRTNLSRATPTSAVTNDAFVARLNTNLSANLASTYLGGTNDDGAYGLAVDTNNFIYVAGYTTSTNFPAISGYTNRNRGLSDAFVAKLSGELTNAVASTYLGGTSNEVAYGIAVAPFTNIVCVVGYTTSTNYPQNPPGIIAIALGYTNKSMGGKDAFLTRLDLGLTNILASTYLGGTRDDEARVVLATATNNTSLRIYVAGWTASSNFPVTTNAYDTTANGERDVFVSYFGTGDTLRASTYLGGATNDSAYALALQADRFSLFVAGSTASTNFPATLRAYNNDRTGQTNDYGFVTKLGSGLAYGTIKWQVALNKTDDPTAIFGSPSMGWDGNIYIGAGTNLFAYDMNGRLSWRYGATGRLVDPAGPAPFMGLGSTPAVAQDGTIYVGADDGSFYAVSPTGSTTWTFNGTGPAWYSSPTIGSDGTIYFGAAAKFYAILANGVALWTNQLSATIAASAAIDTNGTIYVAKSVLPGKLYAINPADGTTNCTWDMTGDNFGSPAIGTNGLIYIGSGDTLYSFDPPSGSPSGTTNKTWAVTGTIYSSPAISSNGMIYVGGGSNLYAFDTNDTPRHVWFTGGEVKSSPAIDNEGSIIVGGGNSNLFSFNPNGTTNWVLQTDNFVDYSSPLIRRDGTIYMADEENLYAVFGPQPAARTNWPAARHDILRTGNAAFDAAQVLKLTNLTASQGAYLDGGVVVSWSADPNADYYEVFRGTNESGTKSLIKTDLLTTNYVDTNITPGAIYYYWARVATPVAMSDFSDSYAGGVPPLPPTNVIASKGTPTNHIEVTWSNSANAAMFYVFRNAAANDTNTAEQVWVTNGITPVYADTNITRGLAYYYWVKASNGLAGISDFSLGDGFTNKGGTPPREPTNITASTDDYRWVNIAWSNSTGADMYAVYRSTNDGIPTNSFIAVTNGLTFADKTAAALIKYYYCVRSTNAYGMGEYSPSQYGYRFLLPPTNVCADSSFTNKIRVSWQADESAATSYLIYRNTSDSAPASNQYETASTSYDDLFITRGAGYYYWVRSKNSYGTSVFSEVTAIAGTVPFPPLNVNATKGTDETKVTVTWRADNYATGYEVFRQEIYAPWSLPANYWSVAGTNYSDTLARPGQRYYYWVKSTNQFGSSELELSGFDTGYRPMESPSAISADDGVSVAHLNVTWSVSDNASSYELWRGTNSTLSAALMLVNAVTTNVYDDTASVPGVMYYYWVKAKTTQFVSDFSPYDSGYRALREVDIGVSDLVFLPTRMAVGGAPEAVSFRVKNYSAQNMAAPNDLVAYNFYISSNSVFREAEAELIGGANVNIPLVAGNSAVVVLPKAVRNSLAVPTVLPGWYYIHVYIQHAAPTLWLDPNLGNNTISRDGGVIKIGASQPAGRLLVNDYNGDGYTDLAMYQESTGTWQVWFCNPQGFTQGFTMANCGGMGFKAVPGDYDGDGKTDLAVYQESTGTWKIWPSAGDYAMALVGGWGGSGFEPVPGDYDGDGLADPAVYQESTGAWRVWLSVNGYAMESAQGFGGTSWRPVPGDYDGDGNADPAVYQESTGTWKIWLSSGGYAMAFAGGWGGPGYLPVSADYDFDGIMDPAVFQATPSTSSGQNGSWKMWLSASGYTETSVQGWGNNGAVAVPGDYDGDGLTDPAVYWDSFGMWRLWLSSSGYQPMELLAWPGEGFRPVWR